MHYRHYPRAPITEAVFGFDFSAPFNEGLVEKARARLKIDYPFEQQWRQMQLMVDAEKQTSLATPAATGFRLSTLDQRYVLILATNRLTISRLAPYESWEEFRGNAEAIWRGWKTAVGYQRIKRIGVRYINRIDIPMPEPVIRLEDYFALTVQVPQPPYPAMAAHTVQAVFYLPDHHAGVTVNLGVVPPALVNHLSYALDFDFGRDREVPQSDSEIWAYIDSIRETKNMLFEGAITDRTRALFE